MLRKYYKNISKIFQIVLTFLSKCNIYNTSKTEKIGGIILAIGDIIVGIDIGTSKVCTVVGVFGAEFDSVFFVGCLHT